MSITLNLKPHAEQTLDYLTKGSSVAISLILYNELKNRIIKTLERKRNNSPDEFLDVNLDQAIQLLENLHHELYSRYNSIERTLFKVKDDFLYFSGRYVNGKMYWHIVPYQDTDKIYEVEEINLDSTDKKAYTQNNKIY